MKYLLSMVIMLNGLAIASDKKLHENEQDLERPSRYLQAIIEGKQDVVTAMLAKNPEYIHIRASWIGNCPPLSLAIASCRFNLVQPLLKAKADVNAQDDKGDTACHILISAPAYLCHPDNDVGKKTIIETGRSLLEARMDISLKNKHDQTPLELAHELKKARRVAIDALITLLSQ